MANSSTSLARQQRRLDAARWCFLACLFLLPGCRQDMADQPKVRPFRPSTFFADGRSARPQVPGSVARNHLQEDVHFYTGKIGRREQLAWATVAIGGAPPGSGLTTLSFLGWSLSPTEYVTTFPLKITPTVLKRGQGRYNIFCAVCHDRAGTGDGMIVRRGFTRPPSFHTDNSRGLRSRGLRIHLRDAPVGYYFDVITRGYGAMADYASQIPAGDRWAIIAYIRALQLSQHASMRDVPTEKRKVLEKGNAKR